MDTRFSKRRLFAPLGAVAAGALVVSAGLTSAQTPGATETPASERTPGVTQTPTTQQTPDASTQMQDMPSYDKLLAEELDIGVEELQEARSNAWDNYFDELASSGAITEEQADELKNWSPNEILSQAVEKINIVEVRQFAVAQLANVFEMDREQLEEDLSEGKTLQEIAEEQDVDTQDIRMNLRSTANDLIGMGVQAGLITEEQRTELSDAIDSLLDAFIGEDSDISDGTTQVTPTVESPDADETPTQVP